MAIEAVHQDQNIAWLWFANADDIASSINGRLGSQMSFSSWPGSHRVLFQSVKIKYLLKTSEFTMISFFSSE